MDRPCRADGNAGAASRAGGLFDPRVGAAADHRAKADRAGIAPFGANPAGYATRRKAIIAEGGDQSPGDIITRPERGFAADLSALAAEIAGAAREIDLWVVGAAVADDRSRARIDAGAARRTRIQEFRFGTRPWRADRSGRPGPRTANQIPAAERRNYDFLNSPCRRSLFDRTIASYPRSPNQKMTSIKKHAKMCKILARHGIG